MQFWLEVKLFESQLGKCSKDFAAIESSSHPFNVAPNLGVLINFSNCLTIQKNASKYTIHNFFVSLVLGSWYLLVYLSRYLDQETTK